MKKALLETSMPVNENDMRMKVARARTGHFNDCFLASTKDVGTYTNYTTEYPWQAADTLYTSQGGETCGIPERKGCGAILG